MHSMHIFDVIVIDGVLWRVRQKLLFYEKCIAFIAAVVFVAYLHTQSRK